MCPKTLESNKMNFQEKELLYLYSLARDTAINAGEYLFSKKSEDLNVLSDKDRDIKLEVDRESEELIRKKLKVSGFSVVGEEFGGQFNEKGTSWIVDPLDGTSNYFRGLDQCCVSIALINDGQVLIGIIYNFNTNELFSAYSGGGAYCNDKRITVSLVDRKKNASITTGFPASNSINDSGDLVKEFSKWKKVRMFGSAAMSCAYIASGRCDVYKERGVYLWDFAAGICLVEEAGGRAFYKKIDDSRYSVNFTNGKL